MKRRLYIFVLGLVIILVVPTHKAQAVSFCATASAKIELDALQYENSVEVNPQGAPNITNEITADAAACGQGDAIMVPTALAAGIAIICDLSKPIIPLPDEEESQTSTAMDALTLCSVGETKTSK